MSATWQGRGKRLLEENDIWLTQLGGAAVRAAHRADVRDTCASRSYFSLAQKKRKKSLNIMTLPL